MRLEQLEYLTAVVQHGSLRQASEHMHVSQPALSEAIGRLERELGVALLDRRRSGARISPAGRELLAPMSEVLEAADRLRVAAGEQQRGARQVRVGWVNAASSTLVAPAVREFQDGRPGTGVEVVDLQQREIEQGVAEGSLDLGLVNLLAGDDLPGHLGGDLVSTVLVHGAPVVVLRSDHHLAAQDSVSVADLREERYRAPRLQRGR